MPLLRRGGVVFHVFLAVTNIILCITFNCRVSPKGKSVSLLPGPAASPRGTGPRGGWEPPPPGVVGDSPGSSPAPALVLSGVASVGSDTESPGEISSRASCSESSLRESWKRGDAGHGGAALLLPTAPEQGFSSSSPHASSRALGSIKSELQLGVLPPPPSPQQGLRRLNSFSLHIKHDTQGKSSVTKSSLGRLSPLSHTAKKISFSASKPAGQPIPTHRCLLISLPRK